MGNDSSGRHTEYLVPQFGHGRWYDVFDQLPGLGDVEDHLSQATAPLDEGEEWLYRRAVFPRDSLVGISKEV